MNKNNPFLTDVFEEIWCKYFAKEKIIYKTDSFNISLIKNKSGLYFII